MALDSWEERVLQQIESQLQETDPGLGRRLRRPMRGRWWCWLAGVCLLVSAVALAVVPGTEHVVAYGMAGVMLFGSGWCLALGCEPKAARIRAVLNSRRRRAKTTKP